MLRERHEAREQMQREVAELQGRAAARRAAASSGGATAAPPPRAPPVCLTTTMTTLHPQPAYPRPHPNPYADPNPNSDPSPNRIPGPGPGPSRSPTSPCSYSPNPHAAPKRTRCTTARFSSGRSCPPGRPCRRRGRRAPRALPRCPPECRRPHAMRGRGRSSAGRPWRRWSPWWRRPPRARASRRGWSGDGVTSRSTCPLVPGNFLGWYILRPLHAQYI